MTDKKPSRLRRIRVSGAVILAVQRRKYRRQRFQLVASSGKGSFLISTGGNTKMANFFQRTIFISAASVVIGLSGCASTGHDRGPDKAVYHVNDSTHAFAAMRNAGNHLDTDPTTKIVIVTHAQGVDFLMNDAKDKAGNPYNIVVEGLVARGVTFDVCEITLKNRKLTRSQFIAEVKYVPSGVAEITKLQSREGYSYVKP